MEYFKFFPNEFFSLPGNNVNNFNMTNIYRAITVPDEVKNNTSATFDYLNVNVLSPDEISRRLYDDVKYWWVIMHLNDITNMNEDWPIDSTILEKYIEAHYHWCDPWEQIAYYLTDSGIKTDIRAMQILGEYSQDEPSENIIQRYSLTPISLMAHYQHENDKKKSILLIGDDYIHYYDDVLQTIFESLSLNRNM